LGGRIPFWFCDVEDKEREKTKNLQRTQFMITEALHYLDDSELAQSDLESYETMGHKRCDSTSQHSTLSQLSESMSNSLCPAGGRPEELYESALLSASLPSLEPLKRRRITVLTLCEYRKRSSRHSLLIKAQINSNK
jgi:hypothetical protein